MTKTIKIVNPIQAGAYVEYGIKPIKIYFGYGKWVWEFNKEETHEVWEKWKNRELNI